MVTRRTSPRASHSREEIEIDREELVDREGACGLRVEERPLEVEAEAERVGRLDRASARSADSP